jgi:GNAT superfamily N-acetyltransferase
MRQWGQAKVGSVVNIIEATPEDIEYICHLQRIEANGLDSVGFLPKMAFEREIDAGGRILIGRENGDEVGYIYATRNRHGVTKIQQVLVQDDARRLEIGSTLVDAVTSPNDWLLSLRCRENLPAVQFWKDMGFQIMELDTSPKRRGFGVYRFQKVIGGLWAADA